MKITVKYFASIRETIGVASESVATSAPTLAALRDELIARGGSHALALARSKTLRVAMNQAMADEGTVLWDSAEVAFFPPVTGG